MRSLDVSALDPVGVNQNKLRFLEAFAAFCVLAPSPPLDTEGQNALDRNHVVVARRGRDPALKLTLDGTSMPLSVWASDIIEAMQGVCELLDHGDPSRPYTTALAVQRAKVADVDATPSARLLREMREREESFFDLGLRVSHGYRDYFRELAPPPAEHLSALRLEAQASLEAAAALDSAPREPFATYLARYFAD